MSKSRENRTKPRWVATRRAHLLPDRWPQRGARRGSTRVANCCFFSAMDCGLETLHVHLFEADMAAWMSSFEIFWTSRVVRSHQRKHFRISGALEVQFSWPHRSYAWFEQIFWYWLQVFFNFWWSFNLCRSCAEMRRPFGGRLRPSQDASEP